MKARDVMITDVITVGADSSVREVAELLFKHRISALPVLDSSGKLIGIISEADLLRRTELGTDYRRSWWLQIFARKSHETLAIEFLKSHARRVVDLMTPRVITVKPTTPLRDVAAVLEKNGIKRVPVVAKGKVVGIVSRANLIQALATVRKGIEPSTVNDSMIRKKVMARFKSEPWSKHAMLNVTVHDGVVKLWGAVESEAEKKAARIAAKLVQGVRGIENNIVVLRFG